MKIKFTNLWKSNLGFTYIIFWAFASMPRAVAFTVLNFTLVLEY